jgi:hypothetical protein
MTQRRRQRRESSMGGLLGRELLPALEGSALLQPWAPTGKRKVVAVDGEE